MTKKLLLTGGAGFIGHHVVEGVLKNTDWDIIILDCLTYAGSLKRLSSIDVWEKEKGRVKFVWHDLRAPISEIVHKDIGEIDYVWHLAAESHVDKSLEDAMPFVMSNVVGTTNLLKYIKKYQTNLKRFVYFSTDEVFGPAEKGVFYKEGDACNPSNPYAGSKLGAEAMCKAFAFSHQMPITISRTMNVFAERQHPEKFIPKTVKAILDGRPITIHGTPEIGFSTRCWIHARNSCDALMWITENGEFIEKKHQEDRGHGIYHIVGEERDVVWMANRIAKIIKGRELDEKKGEISFEYINFHETRPGHDFRYAMSGEKLKSQGFEYKLTLKESFDKMVKWMIKDENKKWLDL